MVVRNERIETIRESLRRMEEFFRSGDLSGADQTTLAGIERDLVRMENTLRLFTQYGRKS